jgi:hypothetical protein
MPPMEKLLIVVADYANLTGNNKLNVMGIFNELNPPSYPYRHPQMYLIIKLRAELGEFGDTRKVIIKLLDEDGNEMLVVPQQIKIPEMREGKRPEINVMMSFNNLEFPKPGAYQFVVMVDKDHKGEVSIRANEPTARRVQ